MTDIIDKANEAAERNLELGLAMRASEGQPSCGACYYCGAPLKDGRRFCDAFCRDDWQREQDAIRRQGGVRTW